MCKLEYLEFSLFTPQVMRAFLISSSNVSDPKLSFHPAIAGFAIGVVIVISSYVYVRKREYDLSHRKVFCFRDRPFLPFSMHIHTKHFVTGVLFLLKAFPEELDAHNMIANGEIEAPGFGCCNPNACPSCYF